MARGLECGMTSDVIGDEARVRQAAKVLSDEKDRLAADLVMSLTPIDGEPSPDDIHQAAAMYCERIALLNDAQAGLRRYIPGRLH